MYAFMYIKYYCSDYKDENNVEMIKELQRDKQELI